MTPEPYSSKKRPDLGWPGTNSDGTYRAFLVYAGAIVVDGFDRLESAEEQVRSLQHLAKLAKLERAFTAAPRHAVWPPGEEPATARIAGKAPRK